MLPYMSNIKSEETIIKTFKGLNLTDNISVGELTDDINTTSEYYPSIGSRKRRKTMEHTERIINGLSSFSGYIYTSYDPESGRLFLNFDGNEYEFSEFTQSPAEEVRKFACLSDSILIIPDNIVFYANARTFSKICVSQNYDSAATRKKFDTETNNSDLLDNAAIRYIASFNHKNISFRETTYRQDGSERLFYYGNFDKNLKSGDIVVLKMTVFSDSATEDDTYKKYVKKMKDGISVKIKEITSVTHTVHTGELTETVGLIFDDNTIDTGGYKNLRISKISLERGMPVLEHICSHNNRIWATSGNEIYTSKLGDPSEWNDFSSDSYGTLPSACFSTKAETEGDFTGIIPYNNYIFAFKENAIHKVYGDAPDEYTLYTKLCQGAQNGCGQCICTGENSIIYPSPGGIYVYSDDYPICISQKLGTNISPISACSDNKYYYILVREADGKKMYVYDLYRKFWHAESVPSDALYLTSHGKDAYMATENTVICLKDDSAEDCDCEKIKWNFTLRFDDHLFSKKNYGSLCVRYSLGKNSSFTVRAKYDDRTSGAICGAVYDESHNDGCSIYLPIKRCLWADLEFSGTGHFMLKSLKLKLYRGSEI